MFKNINHLTFHTAYTHFHANLFRYRFYVYHVSPYFCPVQDIELSEKHWTLRKFLKTRFDNNVWSNNLPYISTRNNSIHSIIYSATEQSNQERERKIGK